MPMPGETPFVVLGILGLSSVAGWTLRPLLVSLGRRLEGKAGADPALLAAVEELRQQVQELQAGHHRLAEVEDRLDFAERLLAQREPPGLPPGSPGLQKEVR